MPPDAMTRPVEHLKGNACGLGIRDEGFGHGGQGDAMPPEAEPVILPGGGYGNGLSLINGLGIEVSASATTRKPGRADHSPETVPRRRCSSRRGAADDRLGTFLAKRMTGSPAKAKTVRMPMSSGTFDRPDGGSWRFPGLRGGLADDGGMKLWLCRRWPELRR